MYNYYTGKSWENYYFYIEGSRDQIGLRNILNFDPDLLHSEMVEGTRGEVKILISRKKGAYHFIMLWTAAKTISQIFLDIIKIRDNNLFCVY